MRAYLETRAQARRRCYNHPHRETDLACDRCRVAFCDECLSDYDGQKLCALCIKQIQDLKAMQLTPMQKVVGSLRSLGRTLLVIVVLIAIAVPVFFLVRKQLDRPITPEELARFRYAYQGGFQGPEGINVFSTVLGAQVVRWTSQQDDYPAKGLINEYSGDGWPGWRSAGASFPQEVVVQTDQPAAIQKIILTNHAADPPDSWVKEFEVLGSTESADSGFQTIGRWTLQQSADPQTFTFDPTVVHWVKLRVLSNYGNPSFVSLDEFDAYVVPASVGATPAGAQPSPTAGH